MNPNPDHPPGHHAGERKSRRRLNKILLGVIGFAVLIVVLVVVGSSHTKATPNTAGSPPPTAHAAATPSPSAPTLSAAQQAFVSDMRSQYGFNGSTDSEIAGIGAAVCTGRQDGVSQRKTDAAVGVFVTGSSSSHDPIARLAEKDLCPAYLPQQTVTYIVTGTPGADVTYGPSGSDFNGSVPMRVIRPLGDPAFYAINAQLQGSGSVACTIKVNGVAISTATATGGFNIADCEISQDPLTGQWENTNTG
jgi:hypothetical protein